MGLDETQSNVLSISGSCLTTIHTSPPNSDVSSCEQKRNAEKIKPTRKNGHLVMLLLSNMVGQRDASGHCEPCFGGGFLSVVVGTIRIVV